MSDELRAIVFDFDGTLAETERSGHRAAYNEAFAELGLPYRWDDATYAALLATAGGKERLAAFLAGDEADGEVADGEAAERSALIERVHAVKRRHFAKVAGGLQLRPGVERLVREAAGAGLRLGIATTAAPDGVEAVLAPHAVVRASFDVVAAGDVVPHKKPAPDIYHFALARLGVDASECLAVEDSAVGLAAARAAGIVALVTPSAYTAGEDFDGAAAVLSDLGEPDAPVRTIRGSSPPLGFVDVAYLRALLRRA